MQTSRQLDEATARELAVKAGVDPRSIRRVFRGEKVRGMAGMRALQALGASGLLTPSTTEPLPAA